MCDGIFWAGEIETIKMIENEARCLRLSKTSRNGKTPEINAERVINVSFLSFFVIILQNLSKFYTFWENIRYVGVTE